MISADGLALANADTASTSPAEADVAQASKQRLKNDKG